VASVVLSLTAAGPDGDGFLAAYPGGTSWPGTSNVNFRHGQPSASLVQAAVGPNGKVAFANGSPGGVDLVADVFAWTANANGPQGPAGRFQALAPARILDSRTGSGGITGAFQPGQRSNLQVAGRGGVPASGASAVVINLTVTNPSGPGFLAVWPAGAQWSGTSNLNFAAGETTPTRVIVPLGAGGQVTIANANETADVIADVAGWYTDASGRTGGLYTAANAGRVLDTRDGTGGVGGRLAPGQPIALPVLGVAGVPASGVSAVVLNLTAVNPSAVGFVVAYPDGTAWPLASDLNLAPGRTSSNLLVAKVGAGGKVDFISSGATDLVADLVGWYS
jgi:hypothetical protein